MAESEAPWGEAAANMRMEYAGLMQQAASDGYETEGRKSAQSWACLLWKKLCGIPPKKKKAFNRSDLKRLR